MNTKRMRLVAVVLSAIVLSSPLAMALAPSLIFTNLRGTLHVRQGVPCGGVVEARTSIADGRMEITRSLPGRSDAIGGNVLFDLTRMEMFMTPFTVQHECFGLTANLDFEKIGVQLAKPVRFSGEPIGNGQYRFSIPKEEVLVYESILDNLPVPQPETTYQRPSEDVTGLIDLIEHTAQVHVALSTRSHFRLGCVGSRCLIDEIRAGVQTVEISAAMVSRDTDTDQDRIPDLADNCPLVPNTDQSTVSTPQITAPRDVTLRSCQASGFAAVEATDVCHARPVAITSDVPARFAIGRNAVNWRASDGIDPTVTARTIVRVDDRTPPSASCTAANPGGMFQVSAADDCAGRTTLKLGSYSLGDDEVIKITESSRPGVRLLGTVGRDKVRHFQVGRGEALILATDAAGNSARAVCDASPR